MGVLIFFEVVEKNGINFNYWRGMPEVEEKSQKFIQIIRLIRLISDDGGNKGHRSWQERGVIPKVRW